MQFRPVVNSIFKKLHSNPCGSYTILLIIISTAHGEAVLFFSASYFFQTFILYTK